MEKVVDSKGRTFLFKVEDSADPNDYRKYEDLREAIWHWPADSLASNRNMMCENFRYDGSSLFIGVFAESEEGGFAKRDQDHMVGFAYGFVGVRDKAVAFRSLDNLWFYSQYTGVKPGWEHFGLGVSIKEFQRQALTELFGVHTVTCTYDPLTAVNAHRNIHRFGMEVIGYHAAIYGEFGGRLNRVDVPSDRFTMLWDLRREYVRPASALDRLLENSRIVTRVERHAIEGSNGPVEVEILEAVEMETDRDRLLLEIPLDFYRLLRETDVENPAVRRIPVDWRMKTRDAFQTLLAGGFRVVDFRRLDINGRKRSFYVWSKGPEA